MELNEYQNKAMSTCMPSCDNITYMASNLVAEVGELCGKIAKARRHGDVSINFDQMEYQHNIDFGFSRAAFKEELKNELGDVLWQVSGFAKVMGWSLEEVAQANILKLKSRAERNVIEGNGDNR